MDNLTGYLQFLPVDKDRSPRGFPLTGLAQTGTLLRHLCHSEWRCDLQWQDYNVWVVLSGKGTLKIDEEVWAITAPQVFILRPGEFVSGRHDPVHPLEVWSMHFLPDSAACKAFDPVVDACRGIHLRDIASLRGFLGIFQTSCRGPDTALPQLKERFMLCLLEHLWRQSHLTPANPADWQIEELISEIRSRPGSDWSLAVLCEQAHMGTSLLNEKFRRLTGSSPTQFVIQARVDQASALLRETAMSLAQIAEECGYRDEFFFSRQYKKVMGHSPAAFRKHPAVGLRA